MTGNRELAGVEVAYERVRAAIVEGDYAPGQRLIEQRIAERHDLSRTPVREAMRRLEAEGLVVSERHRGAIVREVSLDEVEDLYELRARLESYAAELAATRATDDQRAALVAAAERFGEVRGRGARRGRSRIQFVRELNAANGDVHRLIVEAAQHERLGTMLRRTVDIPLVFGAFRRFDEADLERSDLFHHLIVQAIVANDGARASRLMTEHIAQGRDVVLSGLRSS